MPINPIAASLVLYFELDYEKLLELNSNLPSEFLYNSLTKKGYSTLHLMPRACQDPFEEFNSWPKEGRDLAFFQMTQRKKSALVKIITDLSNLNNLILEKGVISVIKFESFEQFIGNAEKLAETTDCCFTILYVVNRVPETEMCVLNECKSLIQYQKSLKLFPSCLINCDDPDWSRFAVSFSKGSEGEFRIRPDYTPGGGLFDVSRWKSFPGGLTQLYSLKAELSYVIGITGKYGD